MSTVTIPTDSVFDWGQVASLPALDTEETATSVVAPPISQEITVLPTLYCLSLPKLEARRHSADAVASVTSVEMRKSLAFGKQDDTASPASRLKSATTGNTAQLPGTEKFQMIVASLQPGIARPSIKSTTSAQKAPR